MAGYVYLLGSSTFGWYKIGKCREPVVRVKQIGVLLPFKIRVIAIWRAANHHALERLLHEKCASHRINGEWFRFTGKEVKLFVSSMPEMDKISTERKFTNIEADYPRQKGPKQENPFCELMAEYLKMHGLEKNTENNHIARKAILKEIEARKKVLYLDKVS